LKNYDRGVRWTNERLDVKGERWKAAYLPVWMYSYQQKTNDLLHYVVVNARTKETMGSVPIHFPKLFGVSAIVEVIGVILCVLTMPFLKTDDGDFNLSWLFLALGFVFFGIIYSRYRNKGARHHHEKETKATMDNLQKKDTFVEKRTALKNAKMTGANNTSVRGRIF